MNYYRKVIFLVLVLLSTSLSAQVQGLSGETRFQGTRYVENLLATTTEDFSNAVWLTTTVTKTAGISDPNGGTTAYTITANGVNSNVYQYKILPVGGRYIGSVWIQRKTGIGTITFYADAGSGIDITAAVTTSWQRVSTGRLSTGGGGSYFLIQLATSGDEVNIWHPMWENAVGQTITAPSEYVSVGVLSAPIYHGTYVDGSKLFPYANTNTVSGNVVTTGISLVHGNILSQM